ncbi:hypothetical protein ALC53_11328 [Atta colombica]|uniref:Uncharacterized protein n=1 Tax=Atta colombica TaxID=520822 RepID=A0A151I003_9HYME|nr:hypothetical protein ALC53_11328 [Atta colombica]
MSTGSVCSPLENSISFIEKTTVRNHCTLCEPVGVVVRSTLSYRVTDINHAALSS